MHSMINVSGAVAAVVYMLWKTGKSKTNKKADTSDSKPKNHNLKTICCFCGASEGTSPKYLEGATQLGIEMANRNIGLVYGGGNVGIMGQLARTIHAKQVQVTGVIPEALVLHADHEAAIGNQIVVKDMHTRKQQMNAAANAFIALPGGLGTFEELFEMLCWGQLGLHDKPIGILNTNGFYTPLLEMITHAIDQGFMRPRYRDLFVIAEDPKELLNLLESMQPPVGFANWQVKP